MNELCYCLIPFCDTLCCIQLREINMHGNGYKIYQNNRILLSLMQFSPSFSISPLAKRFKSGCEKLNYFGTVTFFFSFTCTFIFVCMAWFCCCAYHHHQSENYILRFCFRINPFLPLYQPFTIL